MDIQILIWKEVCNGSSQDHTYIQSKVKPEIFVEQRNLSVNKCISYFDKVFIIPSEEGLKTLLMKVKEESEKVGSKLNIQKTKIMASGPITSWEIDGKQWKQCQTLFWGAPKSLQMVTAIMKLKDTYSLEGKLWLT